MTLVLRVEVGEGTVEDRARAICAVTRAVSRLAHGLECRYLEDHQGRRIGTACVVDGPEDVLRRAALDVTA